MYKSTSIHVSVLKKDVLLQQPYLLLCHTPVASEALDNMSKALQDKSSSRRLKQGSRRLIIKLLELSGNIICVHTNQVTILHK